MAGAGGALTLVARLQDPGVLTSSHALWAYRSRPAGPLRRWFVLGAVAPDLPAFAGVAVRLVSGDRGRVAVSNAYERGAWRPVLLATHSILGWAALVAVTRPGSAGHAAARGAISHVAVDVVSHHEDAWPVLWPLSSRRWRSPVSYWQLDRHARGWVTAEVAALLVAGRRTSTSAERLWIGFCVAMAALPLLRARCWTRP